MIIYSLFSYSYIFVLFIEIQNQFCTGLPRENDLSSCQLECVNGRCSIQNACECYSDYEKHSTQNSCIPKCAVGYIRQGDICKPYCKRCLGDRCVGPGKCICKEGYYLNNKNECIHRPICNPPCGNGTCTRNQCKCHDGYDFKEDMNPSCVPSCRHCQTPACAAPGRCECPEYYTPTYLTVDMQICDCSNDCDTKCAYFVCGFPTSSATPLSTTNESIPSETVKSVITSTKDGFAGMEPFTTSTTATVLYASAGVNIILLLIIVLILMKRVLTKCTARKRDYTNNTSAHQEQYMNMSIQQNDRDNSPQYEYISNNMSESRNAQYTNLSGANQHMRVETPQYESMDEEYVTMQPMFRYHVQTPLPDHLRKV